MNITFERRKPKSNMYYFRLEQEQADKIEAIVKKYNTGKAEVIRKLVEEALKEVEI